MRSVDGLLESLRDEPGFERVWATGLTLPLEGALALGPA